MCVMVSTMDDVNRSRGVVLDVCNGVNDEKDVSRSEGIS